MIISFCIRHEAVYPLFPKGDAWLRLPIGLVRFPEAILFARSLSAEFNSPYPSLVLVSAGLDLHLSGPALVFSSQA